MHLHNQVFVSPQTPFSPFFFFFPVSFLLTMSIYSGCHGRTIAPKGRQPRGVTPCPRSGAAAKSTRLRWRMNGWEELPHIRGHRGRLRGDTQCPRSGTAARRSYPMPPCPRPGAAAVRTNPTPEARGCGREDQPHVQGAVAAGAGGPRGAIPRWRSGRAVVRRYPWSKVRSSGCALLEQPRYPTPKERETQVRR